MTYGQMYTYFQRLMDKAAMPYVPQIQFDDFANGKYQAFVTSECPKVETTQGHSFTLFGLYKTFSKPNSNLIVFPTDIANMRYLIRFNSTYKKICGVPQRITYPVVNIRKAPNNNVDEMQNDPFNKGIDEDPCYVETVSGGNIAWQVLTDTPPLNLGLTYIKEPTPINSTTNPTGVFELKDFVARAIVESVVNRTDVVIENFARSQMEAARQPEIE